MFLPDAETQRSFNDSIKNSFTQFFDEWVSDRRVVNTELEYQVDIGCSHKIIGPKYAVLAHQSTARSENTNKILMLQYLILLMLENLVILMMLDIQEMALVSTMMKTNFSINIDTINCFMKITSVKNQ